MNARGGNDSVKKLLAQHGAPSAKVGKCWASDHTRDVACEVTASEAELDAFAKDLEMDLMDGGIGPKGLGAQPDPLMCPAKDFETESTKRSRTYDKKKVGYDYVYLYRTGPKACVQIRYGWG
jgi:hypothetical protein